MAMCQKCIACQIDIDVKNAVSFLERRTPKSTYIASYSADGKEALLDFIDVDWEDDLVEALRQYFRDLWPDVPVVKIKRDGFTFQQKRGSDTV